MVALCSAAACRIAVGIGEGAPLQLVAPALRRQILEQQHEIGALGVDFRRVDARRADGDPGSQFAVKADFLDVEHHRRRRRPAGRIGGRELARQRGGRSRGRS
jgi:hypothetical protein